MNISSVGGMVTIPFGSSLCASKYSLEAISDALRLELYSSGIFVTCIQPASINSGAAQKLATQNEKTIASLPLEGQRRYGEVLRTLMNRTLASETGGSPPIVVAEAVLDVLLAEKPPARRLVGRDALFLKFIARAIPDYARDVIF